MRSALYVPRCELKLYVFILFNSQSNHIRQVFFSFFTERKTEAKGIGSHSLQVVEPELELWIVSLGSGL